MTGSIESTGQRPAQAHLGSQIASRLAARQRRVLPLDGSLPAAVAVPLIPLGEQQGVLLTRRSDAVEHHKGEICFPGGRVEPEDGGARQAALRETWEEVGVRPDHLRVLGTLDDFVSISGYRVRPFVTWLGLHDYPFRPQPREVEEILLIPLPHLMDPAHHRSDPAPDTWGRRHHYYWRDRVVWGLTASILHHFLRVAFPDGDSP